MSASEYLGETTTRASSSLIFMSSREMRTASHDWGPKFQVTKSYFLPRCYPRRAVLRRYVHDADHRTRQCIMLWSCCPSVEDMYGHDEGIHG